MLTGARQFRRIVVTWATAVGIATTAAAAAATEPGEGEGPRIIWPDDPAGGPIRAAVTELLPKIRAGDRHGAETLFAGEGDDAKVLAAVIAFVGAERRFREVLTNQFGDVPTPDVEALFYAPISDMQRRLMVVKGDRASIASAMPSFDLGYRLVRGKDGWRVTGLTTEPADAGGYHGYLDNMAAITADVSARIEARGFEEADAAEQELVERAGEELRQWALPESPSLLEAPPKPADVQHLAALPVVTARGLLGRTLRSAEVARFVARLPGLPSIQEDEGGGRVDSREGGISLVYRGRRAGVRKVHLFGDAALGHHKYPGELPEGLSFADTRADVERKLGRPHISSGDKHYSAMYPRLGLEVEYEAGPPRDPAVRVRLLTLTAPSQLGGDDADGHAAAGGGAGASKPSLAFRLVEEKGNPEDPTLESLVDPDAGPERMRVSREVLVDETAVAKVYSTPADEPGVPDTILLEMTPEGAEQLQRVTTANLNRRLAIVLDGRVLIAPVVRGVIRNHVAIQLGTRKPPQNDRDEVLGRLHAAVYALP